MLNRIAWLRRISWLLALGLGCVALAWGLLSLHDIFVEERDEALAEVAGRRRALEQYAHQELTQRLGQKLAELRPRIEAASGDPLPPASQVLYFDRGEQRLPRTRHPTIDGDGEAATRYQRLTSAPAELLREAEARDPYGPWAERLRLLLALDEALDAGERSEIEALFRAILAHRASYLITTEQDLPYTLAVLTALEERAAPHAKLMEAMLRSGVEGRGARIEGLERLLLRHLGRFTAAEVRLFAERIKALAEPHNVLYADFSERVEEAIARATAPSETLVVPPDLSEPSLLYRGRWYVEPAQDERTFGVAVDLDATLQEIAGTMRQRGLIAEEDQVLGTPGAPTVALSDLALEIGSASWPRAETVARQRYRLKTALEGVIALLVLGVMVLGAVIYRRRHRFLELKSDFVSAVSHELRTPLASIRLMAETLERRTQDLPKAKDYPARIIRDVDGLSFLVENILSFNRLEKGRWTPRPQRFALRELVDKLERDRDAWARGPSELTWEGVDGVELEADPDLLQLVLTNLARNACLYNERTPARVHVAAQRGERQLVVQVRDNGVGIAPGDVERVFDDFYRSGEKTQRGSGLGLSICRKILEAHGGDIQVASSGPEGTTFELRLPLG